MQSSQAILKNNRSSQPHIQCPVDITIAFFTIKKKFECQCATIKFCKYKSAKFLTYGEHINLEK